MSVEVFVAAALVLALLLFALAGGADFGGGMWTMLARGERAGEQARLVDRAIGPVWEVNELWIVVAAVILWCGFPSAFTAVGITLFVPLILVLAGILIRGAFFAFQHEAEDPPTSEAFSVFGKVFGAVSFLSPLFFGVAAGAIASGELRLEPSQNAGTRFETLNPASGYLEPWLGVFPWAVGVLAVVTCAYLAAVYLTMEAESGSELQEVFRRRGIVSGTLLGGLGTGALPVTALYAPYLWRGLTGLPGAAFMALAAISLVASIALLFMRRFWWARACAILEVVAVFGAWAWAQFPYLVVSDISIYSAAAPQSVLIALLVLSFVYAAVLGPSLALLLYIFKRSPAGHGGQKE